MIEVASREPSMPTISVEQYRRVMALDWNTTHTDRARRETGVATVCVAFDPNPERVGGPCWLLAQRILCRIRESGGKRADLGVRAVPYVFAEWRNEDGTARDIEDGALGAFLRSRDRHRRGDALDAEREAVTESRDRSRRSIIADVAKDHDTLRAFRGLYDASGRIAHRKGGEDGGKVQNTALWTSGTGHRSAGATSA